MASNKDTGDETASQGSGVILKRQVGLISGIALIVGSMVGSGIFVSPKGILREAGSAGMSLMIWVLCAFLSMSGGTHPESCPNNQAAEIGRPGYIYCDITEEVRAFYWFDSVSDGSPLLIQFKPTEGVKSGPGFESGEYDVLEDGSLIIQNVTKWHQRNYTLIISKESSLLSDNLLILFRVIAIPVDEFPVIECDSCHQVYYYNVMKGDIPSCSFNAARPPVQLEWFEQFDDNYTHLEMEYLNITENRNGTYNSMATLNSLEDSSHLVHLLLCRATWPLSDWRREKEIMIDFSSNISFSHVTPKVLHLEVNRHGKIQCGQSASIYLVWKRILSIGEPEIIGFHSHFMTETVSSTLDIVVSADRSLIFSSPQVHHEGIYACIHGDGQQEDIQMTSVKILVPPSPPYIQIIGCDEVSHSCIFKENGTKKLTCAVYGVHPTPTLKWIAENEDEITFFNHNTVIRESGETADITLSVEYEVSHDVLCGEDILIRCHLSGSVSKIMKADSTALVEPASCKEYEVKGGHSTEVWIVLIMLVVLIFALLLVLTRLYWVMKSTDPPQPGYNSFTTGEPEENGEPERQTCVHTFNGTTFHPVKEVSII